MTCSANKRQPHEFKEIIHKDTKESIYRPSLNSFTTIQPNGFQMAPSKGEEGVVQIMFSPKGPAFLTWIVQMVMEDWGDDEGLWVHGIQLEFNGSQIQIKPRLKRNKYIYKNTFRNARHGSDGPAECPWERWSRAWRGWHRGWCLGRDQPGRPLRLPGGPEWPWLGSEGLK